MDLDPSNEQSLLIEAFDALYAKWATPERVRGAEPVGFDADLWQQLLQIGALGMGVPVEQGGMGASLLDLELVAERHGRHLAPAPMLESQAAARLLARCEGAAASDLLATIMAGEQMVTLALHPVRAESLTMVPGGSVADVVLALDGDRVLGVPLAGNRRSVPNLGSLSLSDVLVPATTMELARGADARTVYASAADEWMVLMGGALAGLAQRALEIGVDYVKQREAFGVPIGSFQGVAHPLADSATAVDGALLLARKAAWAGEASPDRSAELAAMSFAFASEAARDASYRSLHFHGGYGFMMEYDVQLYFRRAKAWPAVLREPRRTYELVASRRRGWGNGL
ncbi:MAG: acyl-CoA dehydrogenase family protein [Acidimicrobiales bacterium]